MSHDASSQEKKASSSVTMALRKEYQKDQVYTLYMLLMVCMTSILLLIGIIYLQYTMQPQPQYFVTHEDGRLFRMRSLSVPNMSTNTILQWASEATTACYSYNFATYRQDLADVETYFTKAGYRHFLDALKRQKVIDEVLAKKMVVSSVLTKTPVIKNETVMKDGRRVWLIEVPILVSYQTASDVRYQNLVVTILVSRVATTESARGIGIAQFTVKNAV